MSAEHINHFYRIVGNENVLQGEESLRSSVTVDVRASRVRLALCVQPIRRRA